MVKRELSDIRFSQTETNRSTQDSLESRAQRARPRRRPPVDDRGRSARGALRAAAGCAAEAYASRSMMQRAPAPISWPACADAAAAGAEIRRRRPDIKPDLPNPAAAQRLFRPRLTRRPSPRTAAPGSRIRLRRRAARFRTLAGRCRRRCRPRRFRRARSARSWSRMPRPRAPHRAGAAAGSSARARHAAERTRRHAVRAHCRVRRRDHAKFPPLRRSRCRRRASSLPPAAPLRPRPCSRKAARGAKASAKASAEGRRRSKAAAGRPVARPSPRRSARCWSARASS